MGSKSEFYKSIIDIQKQSGQGLSGIVKIKSSEYAQYLDEFIQEGLIEACHTGGSIGHPETNIFYMPTSGYNVWKDDGVDGQTYRRHKGRYLSFVRFYLGLVDKEKDREFDPSIFDFIQNPEVMKEYTEWLTRNDSSLKEMLNLNDFYEEKEVIFTTEEIEWIKERGWYRDNKPVDNCLKQSLSYIKNNDDAEFISLSKRLISLYQTDVNRYSKELTKAQKDLDDLGLYSFYRKRLNSWLESQDQTVLIQSLIK